jgi:diguanylate cyclase (GGDEF)-like protein
MEMLLLAFALADRYNVMRREKARVREQLLLTQQQLVQTLQTSERELEQRVAQRTEELQVLNTKLETLSLTDALTGIANRRHFDDVLTQEWARATRIGAPLALAIMDVDWFKLYNDHYGHPAGDACLRQIAQTLASTVSRSSDLVARYGGEEFVFLAPMTDPAGAQAMARKVVQAVAALALTHAYSPLGHVTLSVGVVSLQPGADGSTETLLRRADAALYQAKHQGRNQVVAG